MTLNAYPPAEERINIATHALGTVLSVIALVLLIRRAQPYQDTLYTVSLTVFGTSLVCLYLASTLYHSAKTERLRARLRILDHATIFILIAGTYTPFCLITLGGDNGWAVMSVAWGLAVFGITLKLFYTGRYDRLSTLMYVFMGWIILVVVKPMVEALPQAAIGWVVAGGVSYTLGAVLYSLKQIPFNHAVFHVFALVGSFCHFMAVYFYVVPR